MAEEKQKEEEITEALFYPKICILWIPGVFNFSLAEIEIKREGNIVSARLFHWNNSIQ